MAALPAETAAGIAVKAAHLARVVHDGATAADTILAASVAQDVARFAPEAAPLLLLSAAATPRPAILAAAAALPALSAAAVAPHPDAELIRLCAEHIAAMNAYNRDGGRLEPEADPLWHAYERAQDAISAAEPRTLAGMLAKARAAKAEAQMPDGSEHPYDTPAEDWAWDLVNDLLRLAEGKAAA